MYPYYFPLYVVGNRCFTREIFDVPSHRPTETPSQSIPEQGHVDRMLYTGLRRSNKHESPPESWLLPRSIAAAAKTLFRVELGHKPPSRRIWPILRHKQEVRFRWWSWASDTRLAGVRMEKEAIMIRSGKLTIFSWQYLHDFRGTGVNGPESVPGAPEQQYAP